MLHFFARRLNELQKVKREERGFTLIELLVVVIIIGILAAIAIPAFLAQRERAYNSAAQSDLRNAAAAAVSCQTANGGTYTAVDAGDENCFDPAVLADYGYNSSAGVTMTPGASNPDTWTATAVHAQGDTTYQFNSDTGRVTEAP